MCPSALDSGIIKRSEMGKSTRRMIVKNTTVKDHKTNCKQNAANTWSSTITNKSVTIPHQPVSVILKEAACINAPSFVKI